MWLQLSKFILNNRISLLSVLTICTLIMAYFGKDVRMDYELPKLVPKDDPTQQTFDAFNEKFGSDNNVLLLGINTEKLFTLDFFNAWYSLGEQIKTLDGVKAVISVAHSAQIKKDTLNKKFVFEPLVSAPLKTQAEVDSIKKLFLDLPFYQDLLYKAPTNASIMGVTIDNGILNSKKRIPIMESILTTARQFAEKEQINVRYSGFPYLRVIRTSQMRDDLELILLLSIALTAFILLLLFRSFKAMLFPIIVVLIGIIWIAGVLVLFGYKITILTALVPPLIVVIGVPNSVYLLNRYHLELLRHGNKAIALQHTVEKISYTIFFANLTTAIGISVFALMRSEMLHEFGIVAGIGITLLFVFSIIIIPVLLSFVDPPKVRHLKHIESKRLNGLFDQLNNWTSTYPKTIQLAGAIILFIAFTGLIQLKSSGKIFDEIPKKSQAYKDLLFFEKNFNGVLPLEILVDTKKKQGVMKNSTLKRIDKVQQIFAEDSLFAKPLSLVQGIKFINQAFYNGKPQYYDLPGSREQAFILKYLKNMDKANNATTKANSNQLLNQFTDSTQQIARISIPMADVGSDKFPILLDSLKGKIGAILDSSKYDVTYTGTSLVSYSGYNYLIKGLINSVLLAFLLIALVVGYIFRSFKMLGIALIPNIIPLTVCAAIMGYCDIYLKPSTVLIFSLAFGISVDFTIHFLAKYRQELSLNNNDVEKSVAIAVRETGVSMLYTAIILFFGFILFTLSSFEGTFYVGLLTSITIIVALFANLVLLPTILRQVKIKPKNDLK